MSIFNTVPRVKAPRSNFDLGHMRLMTTDFGQLGLSCFTRVFPGDIVKGSSELYVRLAPMWAPVMARCNAYIHWFYCPERILYKDCEDFHTGGKYGTAKPVKPILKIKVSSLASNGIFKEGTLWDYLGLPTYSKDLPAGYDRNSTVSVELMPFLAYYKIWQYYYADQNLTDFVFDDNYEFDSGIIDFDTLSANDKNKILELFKLRKRCWEKDYFTSALPFPQRGEDVRLPIAIGGVVPVEKSGALGKPGNPWTVDTNGQLGQGNLGLIEQSNKVVLRGDPPSNTAVFATLDPNGDLSVDGSKFTVGSPSITELRKAEALQKYMERKAQIGWRYFEWLKGVFGVSNPDGRMQMPEYLGGGRTPITVGEVLQTSQTTTGDNGSPLGDMAGRGVAVGRDNGFRRKITEPGFLFGVISVIPRSSYSQGFPRTFNLLDPLDYPNHYLANIGEQEVKTGELYFDFTHAQVNNDGTNGGVNDQLFGYQSRYSEFKYIPSSFHGDFRTSMTDWHMGRIFSKSPALNEDFVEVHSDETSRVFNVRSANGTPIHHLWCQIYNNLKVSRLLTYQAKTNL